MKLFLLLLVSLVVAASIIALPRQIFAADPATGGLVQCGRGDNPGASDECNFDQLVALIQRVITYIMVMSVPLASIVFAWAGFKYLTAAGNMSQIQEAHSIFRKVLFGFIIVLSAWLIVYGITSVLLRDSSYSLLK